MHSSVVGRARLLICVAGVAVLGAGLVACTPSPSPYPFWGPYGSAAGVTTEAQNRSARLEQYVKDWLDGKVPAQIPDSLIPEGHDSGVKNFYLQRPSEIDPAKQWGSRPAHVINTAAAQGSFPDPHASYLLMPQFLVPFGSKVVITGQFPRSRYFSVQPTPSFKAEDYRYGAFGEGEVAYVDADIKPDPGSVNPFRAGANRTAANRSFTLTCDVSVGDPKVLDGKAWTPGSYRDVDNNNRHCSGLVYRGPWGDPNANVGNGPDKKGFFDVGQIWVRYYAPDKNVDAFGGVPWPKVTYQLPDGRRYFINADISAFSSRVNATRALDHDTPKDDLAFSKPGAGWGKQWEIFRTITEGEVSYYNYPYTNDPVKQKEYVRNLSKGVSGKASDAPGIMSQEPHATAGVHITYLTRGLCLSAGSTFSISGTMPTTPKTRAGEPTMRSAQARYWSITGYSVKYDLNDPNYVTGAEMTSIMDDEIVTDAQNRYIIMYGRPADRPANATAANGITWVDWGPETCQAFTMRWMSIAPEWSFPKSPNETNLGWETDWASTNYDATKIGTNNRNGFLGNYQPIVSYLTKAQAEALGKPDPLNMPRY